MEHTNSTWVDFSSSKFELGLSYLLLKVFFVLIYKSYKVMHHCVPAAIGKDTWSPGPLYGWHVHFNFKWTLENTQRDRSCCFGVMIWRYITAEWKICGDVWKKAILSSQAILPFYASSHSKTTTMMQRSTPPKTVRQNPQTDRTASQPQSEPRHVEALGKNFPG